MFQVVEEMRREPELDMASALEVFRDHDERVRGFLEKGTATEHDEDPVRTMESLTWRIQGEPVTRDQQQLKPILRCPKCPKMDRNRCPNAMKLHIFHHYLDFWRDKVNIETLKTFMMTMIYNPRCRDWRGKRRCVRCAGPARGLSELMLRAAELL